MHSFEEVKNSQFSLNNVQSLIELKFQVHGKDFVKMELKKFLQRQMRFSDSSKRRAVYRV